MGGPIEGIKQLAHAASLKGHKIEVVSVDDPDSPHLSNFPLPVHPLGRRHLFYGFSPNLEPWIRRNASRYDIVIVNGLWQYPTLASWAALRGLPTPYVVFTHGMLDPWFKRTYPGKHLKKWLYWQAVERRVLRDAAAVLFTSDSERLLARESFSPYQVNEVVVGYGTSGLPKNVDWSRPQLLSAFPQFAGKKLVLFLGRIHPKKGCDIAIQAFARALGGRPEWHLVMAGPDQVGWRAHLVQMASSLQIAEQITWTGLIEGQTKWELLLESEALFLPSHQENFGIVIAEALSCGLPVLISDQVNIWREVKDEHAGLVDKDDLAGATAMLQKWLDMTTQQQVQMRENARKCFEQRFEIFRSSNHLFSILENIYAEKERHPAVA